VDPLNSSQSGWNNLFRPTAVRGWVPLGRGPEDPFSPLVAPPAQVIALDNEWRAAFQEYALATAELAKNPETIKKMKISDRGQLNEAELTLLDRFEEAGEQIDSLAKRFYETNPSRWRDFALQLNRCNIQTELTFFLQAFDKQRLPENEKILLYRFAIGGESERRALLRGMSLSYGQRWTAAVASYNGWQTAESLFSRDGFLTMYRLLPGLTPALNAEIVREAMPDHLASFFDEKIRKTPVAEFGRLVEEYTNIFNNEPPGSKDKVELFRWLISLQLFSEARQELPKPFSKELNKAMPTLPIEIREAIEGVITDSFQPLAGENQYLRDLYLDLIQHLQTEYLLAPLSSQKRDDYALAYAQLYELAEKYKIPPRMIELSLKGFSERLGVPLRVEGEVADMAELARIQRVTVSPAGLPKEVKEILMRTGYWDLVNENPNEIIFKTDINNHEGAADSRGGDALWPARVIRIDITDQNQKIRSAWEIAQILVHEAAHIKWRDSTSEQYWRSTPNERQAYLTDAAFLRTYLLSEIKSGRLSKDSSEAEEIAGGIAYDRLLAQGANLVLGNKLTDYEINDNLPSADLLAARKIENLADLDLDYYPTILVRPIIERRIVAEFRSDKETMKVFDLLHKEWLTEQVRSQLYDYLLAALLMPDGQAILRQIQTN